MRNLIFFFDKLEIGSATSHLILLLYFILDYKLYKIIVKIDKETSSSMVKKYCQKIHNNIREKFWPYCGISLAVTAAFLTGVDITAKLEDMVKSVVTQKKRKVDINKWINNWVAFSKSIVPTVISFIKDLNFFLNPAAYEAAGTVEKRPKSDFDLLFDPPPNKALKSDGPMGNKCLEDKINLYFCCIFARIHRFIKKNNNKYSQKYLAKKTTVLKYNAISSFAVVA